MTLAALEVITDLRKHQQLLIATTRVELIKRYAGSLLGVLWLVLNPILFLSVYLFLYLVIFKVRLPEMSELGFSLFVFAGLVPYMAVMEIASTSTQVIRGNIGFIKNLVFPIALVPMRAVIIGMLSEVVGLVLVLVVSIIAGEFRLELVPILLLVVFIQLFFLMGMAFFLSAFGVMLQDFSYFLNTFLLFIMFVSPIGFKPELVPHRLWPMITFNPFHYMLDAYRSAFIASHGVQWSSIAIFALLSFLVFAVGASFFQRFRSHIVDYE